MNLNIIDSYSNTNKPLGKEMMETQKEKKDPFALLDNLEKMEGIKEDITRFKNYVEVAKRDGLDAPELGHFVFSGKPGTGKTTVAMVMAEILFQLGLLSSDNVVRTSGLGLTGKA